MTHSTHQSRTRTRTAIAGILSGPVLLLVVHTWPEVEVQSDDDPVGRIVSARKATAHERKAYDEGTF
jgi:uncharacterized protein